MNMNVVEASGLGKRYGGTWALRECTLAIPSGHVAALVGPNGAGKTTLLNLAVGLAEPSAGAVTVLGGRPAGSAAALDGIAFVAQDTPLYKNQPLLAVPVDRGRLAARLVGAAHRRHRLAGPPPRRLMPLRIAGYQVALGKMSDGSRRIRSSLLQCRSGSAARRYACRSRALSSSFRTLRALPNRGCLICSDR